MRYLARPRQLSVTIALLGIASFAACLLVPVDAAFGDDPLLRLRSFAPGPAPEPDVDCGSALGSLGRSDGVTLYQVARDGACRAAASRRLAIAVAAGAVLVITGFLGMAMSSARRPAASLPGQPAGAVT